MGDPAPRPYRLDGSVQRHGTTVVGGSPLTLFRLTPAGATLLDRVADGDAVAPSTLVDRLLDAGAIHPDVHADRIVDHDAEGHRYGLGDVTIVTPYLRAPGGTDPTPRRGTILVDDGSDPPVAGATVRLDSTSGPGAARNAGLATVSTELVAFVDADVTLPDGWLEPLLPHFDDERVALVAPRVRSRDTATRLGRYEREQSPLDLGPEPARIRAGTRVSYVPAAAIVCHASAVRDLGGFDEQLRFGEDVDLCWRLVEAGHRCRYEPASEVEHDPRPDWPALVRQRIGYGSSAAPLARRHPGALAPLRMSGWSIGAWLLGAIGRPVLGGAVGLGSAAALVRKLPDLPPSAAFRLAALGNLHAGDQVAAAIRRAWWPLLAIAALRSRSARRVLLAASLAARRPERLLDDVAYSLGLWRGMARERTLDPIRPEITSWPGRAAASRPPASEPLPSTR